MEPYKVSLRRSEGMVPVLLLMLISTAFTDDTIHHDPSLFTLTILHTNDLHSRFDQVNAMGATCSAHYRQLKQCYGGFARIKQAVHQAKTHYPDHVFLNAGDFFQGTVWYSLLKWPIVANMTQTLGLTASSLGNHEFDDGVQDLVRFGTAVKSSYPMLACNLDLSLEPDLEAVIVPSLQVQVGSRTIGIIGYVTPETKDLAQTGSVIFLDEISSIQKEVDRLTSQNVDIIIAVGHSGYDVDIEIAKQVSGLDVVVGGHTNTFLWSGPITSGSVGGRPFGEYPTLVTQESGDRVLVVQTNGYGRYLGQLHVDFDASGRVQSWAGQPVLMDQRVPLDQDLDEVVGFYRELVHEQMHNTVGVSDVFLDGGRPLCRLYECDFGNFLTDAMASEMNVKLAVINSGAIKGSFNRGNITMSDIYETMPWSNTIDVVSLKGQTVKLMLEHAVSEYDAYHPDPNGRFLQVSGMIVRFDVRKPPGSRVLSIHIGRPDERDGWREISDEDVYDVAIPSFLALGGDRYNMIPEQLTKHKNIGLLDKDLLVSYLDKNNPLQQPASGRIILIDYTKPLSAAFRTSYDLLLLAILPLILLILKPISE